MQNRRRRFVWFLLAALFWLMFGPAPGQADEPLELPHFELADCPFPVHPGTDIDCGYLTVPESRTNPTGATIRLAVIIARSYSPAPSPDPVIFLHGGPGGLTEEYLPKLHQFNLILQNRDLIFVDQRGVGWSQPNLDCPPIKDIQLQEFGGARVTNEAKLIPRLACRDRWLADGIDLTAYNSTESAADIHDLWQAMGLAQVNLMGVSYGTMVGQLVMRDFGNSGAIRSVILDSPVPLSATGLADIPANRLQAYGYLFADCAADFLCNAVYPDLDSVYPKTRERLQANPRILTAADPITGQTISFRFDGDMFEEFISYLPHRAVPGLIYDIHDGDYGAVTKARTEFIRQLHEHGQKNGFGMRATIRCNEPVYATDDPDAPDAYVCPHWPKITPPLSPDAPVISAVPTLILTGEYDPIIPPTYNTMIGDSLSNGYPYLIPGASHNVLETGGSCPNTLAVSFLNDSTQAPQSDCLADAGGPAFDTPFVIRAAAARRPAQIFLSILSLFVIGASMAGIGSLAHNRRTSGLRPSFSWRHSFKCVGWIGPLVGLLVSLLAFWMAQTGALLVQPERAMALILPLIAAMQAAFLFSPQDEPALEVQLAAMRPPAWTLLERLAALLALYSSLGLIVSAVEVAFNGESFLIATMRWLPLLLLLCGIAVTATLITGRGVMGVLLTALLWFALTFFGDALILRWPVAWPLHLYLPPDQVDFAFNRTIIAMLGLSLMALSSVVLLRDGERLLLGSRSSSRTQKARQGPQRILPFLSFTQSNLSLTQLMALIRAEFLLQWRGATLPALAIGLMVAPVLGAFISRSNFSGYQEALAAGAISLETARANITAEMIPILWMATALIALAIVPILVAATIPRDRQLGVRELLDALPLPPAIYLTGKLLSLWLNLLACIGLAAVVSGVAWRLVVGPFEIGIFLAAWFVGGAGLIMINGGSSLLLAAGQPTTRRAVLVGIGYAFICLAGLGFAFVPTTGVWRYLNPARPAVFLYYAFGWPGALTSADDMTRVVVAFVQQVAGQGDVVASLAVGLGQVAALWLLAWLWMRQSRE